jgi:hypothetical protein
MSMKKADVGQAGLHLHRCQGVQLLGSINKADVDQAGLHLRSNYGADMLVLIEAEYNVGNIKQEGSFNAIGYMVSLGLR